MNDPRPMQARSAFTLIELLVVVAIIALIIALILPALGRAKEQSRRAVCAANLKGIGIGINVYAEENNNRILPFCRAIRDDAPYYEKFKFSFKGATPASDSTSSVRPYYQPWATLIGANGPPGWIGTTNIGLLLELQLVTNPRIFYCPSASWWEFQYPNPDRWVTLPITARVGQQTPFVATSYMYNPYPLALSGSLSGSTADAIPMYHTRPEFQANGKAIALDSVENWRKIEDISHKPSGGGWNLLFIDSHVDFRSAKASFDVVNSTNPQSPNMWSDMAAMIDPLNNQ